MSRRRNWYYDLESRRWARIERPNAGLETPRTPEARRRDIAYRFGVDESWIVLGEKPNTWKLVAPEEQHRNLMEKRRSETAKQYGVPVSHVWTEDELAKWRASRSTARPVARFLANLKSRATVGLNVCLQVVGVFILQLRQK